MRKELLVASLVAVAVLAAYYSSNEGKADAFEEWKGKFGVSWAPEEEAYRRLIFEKNIIEIEAHNAESSHTYKKGINQFTIYTQEEFVNTFLTPMPMVGVPSVDNTFAPSNDIDWSTQGKVSGVKNQGQCGSCWAFSATGVIESSFLVHGKGAVSASEQQLVDCSRPQGNQGCNGGWPSNALKYVAAYGIASESQYAYTGKDGTCRTQGGSIKIANQKSFSGCAGLTSGINSEPISVTVDATNWSAYRSGIFSNCAASINHAVLLVGVVGGAWKIKNSWGTTWGEQGYVRLNGGNTCGLCAYAGVVPV
jgi:C1A family cysteine protease